ncbi:di-trans,poly-cis-decaprenylcistransferase [Candidatus Daviesbacteria bacterium RIFCSPLOWO2_01_FULL_43_38]|uniref:Isoprenyl transferase n=1 Tax=Candidatus Daviesbacteria bacterium RIFCSPHIGHO2_12_FULL_43_11 TaxID=1797780 RepID=A0A1F5K867_9BACT|nr:MAG: di-trans,poly-cis-decaprenylcistransferase [Candidatus Daviesbacteria bacterium RIFCSPHIGHO2_01_FULL_43_17]OGE37089.1 MAG: di-trans,poly-cis-decaprenylcistransferase [Candidatus Daviesbacteria bacterium RIFCSPHIGHO2_12_FULL_43_11]OGE64002.1 MAG: di-trans,poly-cis-decaprenylcistransferase [Candidatus Daviesbacteria bacterium RIFCSPLOWO2_01_FULL_43_38]OGE70614.1 MAG: di-trans,poly-cis-decaprenylcistransferase [Candidatus Daviesbacteria bacterium RIFCSPLOWO2_02_FULL_43_11]
MPTTKNSDNIPSHIAIIMDGNRRWARVRNLPEGKGHEAGAEALEKVVEAASKMGIKTITVYALSTENIKERARREVLGLFGLMKRGYNTKLKKMMKNGVRVDILGELNGLPKAIKMIIEEVKKAYIKNESIRLNIALNYGGKRELIEAVKEIVKEGVDINKISEKTIDRHLYTNGQNDPGLVIRTGGYIRLSNFLLWQTAYSELYFSKKLWPDFGPADLKEAVEWYQDQKRNFGK